jgi:hypothetical protein
MEFLGKVFDGNFCGVFFDACLESFFYFHAIPLPWMIYASKNVLGILGEVLDCRMNAFMLGVNILAQ